MAEVVTLSPKTVTYNLFKYHGVLFFSMGGTFWTKDYSISAIVEGLTSAKIRGSANRHTLIIYIRIPGGTWEKILEAPAKTVEKDVTSLLKKYPNFELRADLSAPFTIFDSCIEMTGALELTYIPPPEPTIPEYTGEFSFGSPELGEMFNFMMQMFMMMMLMTLMTSMIGMMGGS